MGNQKYENAVLVDAKSQSHPRSPFIDASKDNCCRHVGSPSDPYAGRLDTPTRLRLGSRSTLKPSRVGAAHRRSAVLLGGAFAL